MSDRQRTQAFISFVFNDLPPKLVATGAMEVVESTLPVNTMARHIVAHMATDGIVQSIFDRKIVAYAARWWVSSFLESFLMYIIEDNSDIEEYDRFTHAFLHVLGHCVVDLAVAVFLNRVWPEKKEAKRD